MNDPEHKMVWYSESEKFVCQACGYICSLSAVMYTGANPLVCPNFRHTQSSYGNLLIHRIQEHDAVMIEVWDENRNRKFTVQTTLSEFSIALLGGASGTCTMTYYQNQEQSHE